MQETEVFEKGRKILHILNDLGYESYFVGGALRDYRLGREIHDIDIATPLLPDEVMRIFPKTVPIGVKHGTVLVLFEGESFEVTTFRMEDKYDDFRHPNEVYFVKDIVLDLARRDFTMNAMAMNQDNEWMDPYHGLHDIQRKCVRAVGDARERFFEDPLRILRGYRFCAQLDFDLDVETEMAACESAHFIQHISIERIQLEMEKLLNAAYPQAVWKMLEKSDICSYMPFGKSVVSLYALEEYDFTKLHSIEEKWVLLYAALQITTASLQFVKWRFSNQKRKTIERLFSVLEKKRAQNLTKSEIYTLGLAQSLAFTRIQSELYHLDSEQRQQQISEIWHSLPIKNRSDLLFDGKDVLLRTNQKKGPWLGVLLKQLEAAVLNGECVNNQYEMEEWIEKWLQKSENKY